MFHGFARSGSPGSGAANRVLEERVEADLAVGRHGALVVDERLVREQPLREGLRWPLMLALSRSGRQAEALSPTRRPYILIEELGIEPGRSLRGLIVRFLEQDPALDLPREPRRRRCRSPVGFSHRSVSRSGRRRPFEGRHGGFGPAGRRPLLAAKVSTPRRFRPWSVARSVRWSRRPAVTAHDQSVTGDD